MLHIERIKRAVDHIENHLHLAIELEQVSQAAFSSLSYMHRIFYQITGMTMKEYIRLRRLAKAVLKLQSTNCSILEAAIASGFQSAESFSRAFKKEYGLSASVIRNTNKEIAICRQLDCTNVFTFTKPKDLDFNLELTAVNFSTMTIIGFQTSTTMNQNQHILDICTFANQYLASNQLSIYFNLAQTDIYGVYTDMTSQEDFNYTIGGLKEACIEKAANMVEHVLPAASYAKFSLNRHDRIKEAWHYIYGSWFPQISALRAHGYDFEIYHHSGVDIYIPMTEVPLAIDKE